MYVMTTATDGDDDEVTTENFDFISCRLLTILCILNFNLFIIRYIIYGIVKSKFISIEHSEITCRRVEFQRSTFTPIKSVAYKYLLSFGFLLLLLLSCSRSTVHFGKDKFVRCRRCLSMRACVFVRLYTRVSFM